MRWFAARAGESLGGSGLSGRPEHIDELSSIQMLYHNNSNALDQFEIKPRVPQRLWLEASEAELSAQRPIHSGLICTND